MNGQDNTRIPTSARKIFEGRVDGGTSSNTYKLPPMTGYASVKNIVIFIKILAKSSTNPHLQYSLYHGPDCSVWVSWGDVIASTEITDTPPCAIAGATDVDTDGHFGDILQHAITCTGSGEWANIEVYEVRKAF